MIQTIFILIAILIGSGGLIYFLIKRIQKTRDQLNKVKTILKAEREWKVKAELTIKKLSERSNMEVEDVKKIMDLSNSDDIANELNNILQE